MFRASQHPLSLLPEESWADVPEDSRMFSMVAHTRQAAIDPIHCSVTSVVVAAYTAVCSALLSKEICLQETDKETAWFDGNVDLCALELGPSCVMCTAQNSWREAIGKLAAFLTCESSQSRNAQSCCASAAGCAWGLSVVFVVVLAIRLIRLIITQPEVHQPSQSSILKSPSK